MRTFLRFKSHFDAAHQLRNYEGKCANLHGHRWYVEVEVSGEVSLSQGILIDFTTIKDILSNLLPDHCFLNDLPQFRVHNPTAENIALWLFGLFHDALPDGVRLESVRVWESDNASATVKRGC
jgi:6-pyruvoyltetrahydropterin/6-carboxytetrahydropterin synthase